MSNLFSSEKPFYIVADGACMRNPGPGGWGLIIATPDDDVIEFGGYEEESTNNRMELMGLYRGLQEVYKRGKGDPGTKIVHVISDSKYVLDGAETFVFNWEANGWKTAGGGDVKNRDLWEKVVKGLHLLQKHNFVLEYELVKGHAGNDANERVDQIAVKYSRSERIPLFKGKRCEYPVKLETGEAFEPVYMSYINGELKRHSTWDECSKEVTGKPSAKYKKVKNRLDEKETLKSWGVKT